MYKAFNFHFQLAEFQRRFPGYSADMFASPDVVTKSPMYAALESLSSLDADIIQKTWFRDCEFDVFLSHSSKDTESAKSFGAFLERQFGLEVFVDSVAWNHVDQMLKGLDDKYCVSERNNDGSPLTYSYERRNVTTAHAHMILSHALTKMIDKAECFIYLNTENATLHEGEDKVETASPWLFHELAMVNVIEPKQTRMVLENFSCDGDDTRSYGPTLKYSAETNRLIELSFADVEKWQTRCAEASISHIKPPLSILYEIVKCNG